MTEQVRVHSSFATTPKPRPSLFSNCDCHAFLTCTLALLAICMAILTGKLFPVSYLGYLELVFNYFDFLP